MAYYDKKIEKYCLTKEEMETIPKEEARSRMIKGLFACFLLLLVPIGIVMLIGMTPLGGYDIIIVLGSVAAGYIMLTGIVNVPLQIREYFRNNKRLEYDEKHKDEGSEDGSM